MAMLDRPDTRISYEVAGEGPALLLTHGFAATQRMFEHNLPALAAAHLVVTWDIRGHGASDSPDDPGVYSAAASVGDMVAILDHLGIERAAVAGHSLGGYLSLELAVAHPERVAGLILIDTGPGFRKDEARQRWNRLAERYARDLERDGVAGLPPSDELDLDAHRSATGLMLAARGILAQHDAHILEALSDIAAPALVVVGADDTNFRAGADYMAAKIPAAELVVIDGAGHTPNISHPEVFDRHVLDFLARVGVDQ